MIVAVIVAMIINTITPTLITIIIIVMTLGPWREGARTAAEKDRHFSCHRPTSHTCPGGAGPEPVTHRPRRGGGGGLRGGG